MLIVFIVQYHMMPYEYFDMKLVADFGKGKKKLVKAVKVRPIVVPKFRELTVAALYKACQDD